MDFRVDLITGLYLGDYSFSKIRSCVFFGQLFTAVSIQVLTGSSLICSSLSLVCVCMCVCVCVPSRGKTFLQAWQCIHVYLPAALLLYPGVSNISVNTQPCWRDHLLKDRVSCRCAFLVSWIVACFLSSIKTPRCSLVYLDLKPWNLATVLFAKLLRRGVKYREPVSNAKLSKKGLFPPFPFLKKKYVVPSWLLFSHN